MLRLIHRVQVKHATRRLATLPNHHPARSRRVARYGQVDLCHTEPTAGETRPLGTRSTYKERYVSLLQRPGPELCCEMRLRSRRLGHEQQASSTPVEPVDDHTRYE